MKFLYALRIFLLLRRSSATPASSIPGGADGDETPVTVSWFDQYHSYPSHVDYLYRLAADHPSRATVFTAGKSFEQRDIWGIHLSGKYGPGIQPAVVFLGTVHAREWVSTMVTEYLASRLLEQYKTDTAVKHALDSFDFYIFPVVNPDGFVYSQTKQRTWRKNRQRQNGTSCVGRDLNRNWDAHWHQPGGASTASCRQTYKGSRPLDAPETRALATELKAIKERQGVRLFVDWHAFGQLVLYPYGHSCDKKLPPFSGTAWLAGELADAMKKAHGTEYKAGPACGMLYPTTGDSVDYAFEALGADYAYTVELRPGRRGKSGFKLAEDQIVPTAEEAWGGVRHVLQFIHQH